MNSIIHYRQVKQLNSMIDSYERKLDDKVNEMYQHIINTSANTNDAMFPRIQNKYKHEPRSQKIINSTSHTRRTQSIHSKSFIINNDVSQTQQLTEADSLFKTFKSINDKQRTAKNIQNVIIPAGRVTGKQTLIKPKVIRRKPQILSKQMRWDPFYEKNAIKAQQLNSGMLHLIEKGRVAKNIDIITAFQKGRPILETHQAVVHHLQQKFTQSYMNQSQMSNGMKAIIKKQVSKQKNPQKSIENQMLVPRRHSAVSDQMVQYAHQVGNSWAITIPQDSSSKIIQETQSKILNPLQYSLQISFVRFLHYKIVRDANFKKIKKTANFCQYWPQIEGIINQISKILKKYNIETIYCNPNKILSLARENVNLSKIKLNQIQQCLVAKTNGNTEKKQRIFSIKVISNQQLKKNQAVSQIYSAFKYKLTRMHYMGILHRKKYENKVREWIKNGFIIKNYRKQLGLYKEQILKKFEAQQKKFRKNFQEIQQNKHYQIHIPNRHFMNGFKHFEEFCNTQITRIFNLENPNTNIIYVSPFELNVETINYYFKIMELEQIDSFNERVTFLQLQDIASRVKLPVSLNTSQKLYYNSKALRKLKKKVQGKPAYFVTNYPTEIDIRMSVFLQIPIYSGNFNQINPLRSALHSERLQCLTIPPMPAFVINPKEYTTFQLSNALIRYFESNKRSRKYIIKLNNYSSSAGLALLTYPFTSLPQMYSSTVFIQNYYFKSVEKFYIQLTKYGGVIQKYEEGLSSITVCAKIFADNQHTILGTFQKISSGFLNIGYIFPQKIVPHKTLMQKCKQIIDKLAKEGHIGYVELTIVVNEEEQIFLQQVQLYSTKITNSLFYFKFLAGGYFNNSGDFMTKITAEAPQNENQDEHSTLQPRLYCYIPFILHFGLTDQQSNSFFQLCRIGGVSFDLQNKFGTTFIILGSLKDTVGILTTAKDRKSMIKLISKTGQFLIKQNSHNISTQMLKQKQFRMKQRFNINSIKDRMQQLT